MQLADVQISPSDSTALAAPVPIRHCPQCNRDRPLSEFRRRHKGSEGRISQCRGCHNAAENRRNHLRRIRKDERKFRHHLNDIARAEQEQVHRLTVEMLHEFGGVDSVVGRWLSQDERARPNSYTKMRSVLTLFRLLENAEDEQRERETQREAEIHVMSDDDLEASLKVQVKRIIAEQPDLAVLAALELGWTVIPPGKV